MLRAGSVVVLLVAVSVLAACGDDGGEPTLQERVVAVLRSDPTVLGARADELDGADVVCPDVPSSEPGDRATCTLRFADGGDTEVDVTFQADGSIAIVAVVHQ